MSVWTATPDRVTRKRQWVCGLMVALSCVPVMAAEQSAGEQQKHPPETTESASAEKASGDDQQQNEQGGASNAQKEAKRVRIERSGQYIEQPQSRMIHKQVNAATTSGYEKKYPEALRQILDRTDVPLTGERQNDESFKPGDARYDAIYEAAKTVSIQRATAMRQREIRQILEANAHKLNRLNFRHLMLEDGQVRPPIVGQARRGFQLKSNQSAERTQATFVIHRHAGVVSRPPNWRDYLYRGHFDPIQEIHPALLPRNHQEAKLWRETVLQFWEEGIEQADRIFEIQLNRLKRDFLGMARFRAMRKMDMVSMPNTAEADYGISVHGHMDQSCLVSVAEREEIPPHEAAQAMRSGAMDNECMSRTRIDTGRRSFTITAPAQFTEPENWEPQIHVEEPAEDSEQAPKPEGGIKVEG